MTHAQKFYSREYADGKRAVKASTHEEAAAIVAKAVAQRNGKKVRATPQKVNVVPNALGGGVQYQADIGKKLRHQNAWSVDRHIITVRVLPYT
jgi:hypothetical protein